jgi:hypothetical protein
VTGRSCLQTLTFGLGLDLMRALSLIAALAVAAAGCTGSPTPGNVPASGAQAQPVYNDKSGQLEQIVSDSNSDGKIDTRAFMEGRRLLRIEIDRNNDGSADRFEFYGEAPPERVDPNSPAGRAEIERVEESNGPDGRQITRREFYDRGELARVEDDSNNDGRLDRWELYERGILSRIDMDENGAGFPTRRLVYRRDGTIDRVEIDPAGSGAWREAPPSSSLR